MKKILLATGQDSINKAICKFKNYNILGAIQYKHELIEACSYFSPNIVVLSDGLLGNESIIEQMINAKKNFPKIKFIYLTTQIDLKNEKQVNRLGTLVLSGIYDIFHDSKITIESLKYLLEEDKKLEDVDYLLRYIKEDNNQEVIEIVEETDETEEEENGYKNVFVISSIKPGTGKSFISVNVATSIAKFGKKKNGQKPKVALIEADLQNLSVGTLLQLENDKKNLKTVMDKISTIINEDGTYKYGREEMTEKIEEVNEYIKSCFSQFYTVKNLYALVGSQLTLEEIENIAPAYYVYLIEAMMKEFDVIIIDSNSSLAHVTTFPLLKLAKTVYYVINLDYNNIRNNSRYKDTLKKIQIFDKVKYILNEDITEDLVKGEHEELLLTSEFLEDSGFKIEAKIPLIEKTVFLNRLYTGHPICLDDNEYTLKARYELLKVANNIWEIDTLEKIKKEVDYVNEKRADKKRKRFFK